MSTSAVPAPVVVPAAAPAANTPAPAAKPAAPAAPPTPAQQQAADDFFELNIAGQKERRSWSDPETRKAALEALQKKGFAEKSTSDARTAYKAIEKRNAALNAAISSALNGDPAALHQVLGTNPGEIAKDPAKQAAIMKLLGVDPDAHARTLLSQKLDLANMTPEQRRIAELESKVAETERANKQMSEARRQERVNLRAKQQQAALFKELTAAADRIGLTADENSLAAIHAVMADLHQNDVPMTPDLIVELAKERIDDTFRHLEGHVLKGLKGPQLAQRLGPEVMKELRTHLIGDKDFIKEVRLALAAKVRAGQKLDAPAAPAMPAEPAPKPGPAYTSSSSFDEQVRALGRKAG